MERRCERNSVGCWVTPVSLDPRRWARGCVRPFLYALLMAATQAGPLDAQEKFDAYVFHGTDGRPSSFVTHTGEGYQRLGTRLRPALVEGDSVCITVLNAHTAKYRYSFARSVDTTGVELPDLSDQVALLSAMLGSVPPLTSADLSRSERPPSVSDLRFFLNGLSALTEQLDSATSLAARSDVPESLEDLDAVDAHVGAGFRHARYLLLALPSGPGQFNDPALGETIDQLADSADLVVEGDSELELLASALRAYGESLANSVRLLKSQYVEASATVSHCSTIGAGETSVVLEVQSKSGDSEPSRDVGSDSDLAIEVRPVFRRSRISVHPLGLLAVAPGVPDYRLDGGTVRRGVDDRTAVSLRVGVATNIELRSWGAEKALGLGLALGLGSSGEEVLTDVFTGLIVSYRSEVRLGLGIGPSKFPVRLKPGVAVDEPLSGDSEDLDGLVENDWRLALSMFVTLPGLPGD